MAGTFPEVIADYTMTETVTYNTLMTTMWGAEERRDKWGPRMAWKLFFNHVTTGEMNYIRDFFISQRGNYESFTWTHPVSGSSYTVRFAQPTLQIDEVRPDAFNIQTQLVEVL